MTPVHFTGFEKQETSNGPEYLFYGSNCINYYRDVHEIVISSYYKNIPDIKTCHDRIGDRIWKREITVTEVKNAKESRNQGQGLKRGWVLDFVILTHEYEEYLHVRGLKTNV